MKDLGYRLRLLNHHPFHAAVAHTDDVDATLWGSDRLAVRREELSCLGIGALGGCRYSGSIYDRPLHAIDPDNVLLTALRTAFG